MKGNNNITDNEIKQLYEKLNKDAEEGGYHLNPDKEFTKQLIKSLIINQQRYGYPSCPCRLASGNKQKDLDIICPCDYRDPDIIEYGACYCGLYVSEKILKGEMKLESIPERRIQPEKREKAKEVNMSTLGPLPYPVWRCKVCGYLCARNSPPEVCPICKATNERFEKFI